MAQYLRMLPKTRSVWMQWTKAAAQSACLAGTADLCAQALVRPTSPNSQRGVGQQCTSELPNCAGTFDLQRSSSFAAFGFCWSGFIQRLIYLRFDAALGVYPRLAAVCMKVAADTFLYGPLVYIPAFYMSTGLMQGRSVEESYERLRCMYKETMTVYVFLWPWAMFTVFRAVPEPGRTSFIAFCAFIEKSIYSWMELGTCNINVDSQPEDNNNSNDNNSNNNNLQFVAVNGAFFASQK
ncbi:unnamed protein product [Polarella glacialis]|uniref:Uncharacterized protein n=1 Tax=Polarella glacialis TaxID=89957 RepID=A0A813K3R3_POLGL|nr:unnamed protein product [Polarella glacialis]